MKKRLIIIAGVFLTGVAIIWFMFSTSGEYCRTYSPDKQYSVYGKKYNYEMFIPMMPGGGSDGSGKVFLYDEIEKKVIAEAEINILWRTGDIIWSENKAYWIGDDYPNILNFWLLPRKIQFHSSESKK